ncbi:hypothetical protein [Paracidovorax wautersii]|uniref:hypothetical protein n=1 Tax=Paracidovorax wautersii TaxID=1177982 RepID=UPI0031D75134
MQYLLGFAGLAVGLPAWAIVITLSQGGLPYLDKAAGSLMAWLLWSPSLLCLLPWACLKLQRNGVAAIWLAAIAPIAGMANAGVAVVAGTADPQSRIIVWVLSILWAIPMGYAALRALLARREAGKEPKRSPRGD